MGRVLEGLDDSGPDTCTVRERVEFHERGLGPQGIDVIVSG